MLRKTIVAFAVAFALAASALPTSAFALSSAHGGGRMASGGYVYHGDRVGNLHRGLLHSRGRGYGWDPWGHWGAYYGPML